MGSFSLSIDAARALAEDGAFWSQLGPTIDRALAEDLHAGDVTARATVPVDAIAYARIVAKHALVFSGGPIVASVMERCASHLTAAATGTAWAVELLAAEGERIDRGRDVARLHGPARTILAAERTLLNLLQRACGVATLTRAFADAAGPRLRVTDTRKTMPGLRVLDRYAVRCGGGHNHRNDLGSGVLIKENHIACAGSVAAAIEEARQHAPHLLKIECEVRDLDGLQQAVDAGADVVMLDNFDDDAIKKAVTLVAGRLPIEVSGNVTLDRLPRLAAMGVDLVSVGALTHSAKASDLSLLIESVTHMADGPGDGG